MLWLGAHQPIGVRVHRSQLSVVCCLRSLLHVLWLISRDISRSSRCGTRGAATVERRALLGVAQAGVGRAAQPADCSKEEHNARDEFDVRLEATGNDGGHSGSHGTKD